MPIWDEITQAPTPDAVESVREKLFPGSENSKLSQFTPATDEEIRKFIQKSSSATCDLDPMPTKLVKQHMDNLIPLIT